MPDSPPPYGFVVGVPVQIDSNFQESSFSIPLPMQGQEFLDFERYGSNQPPMRKSSSSSSSSSSNHHLGDETKICNLPQNFGGSWQYCSASGPFPTNLVRAGVDVDNDVIYVARAFHDGHMLPAKFIPNKNLAFVSFDGEEIVKQDFEVLRQGAFVWEFAANGAVPDGAVEIGMTQDGEKLFMGRALYCGSQTPGKVHPSHGCLYIPFEGAEVNLTDYEVLCIK